MSDIVFILGAGASVDDGTPLMANFLDVARDLYNFGQVETAKDKFKTVFDGIGVLQGVHSKSQLDIHNIESVFAAFEMARTLGRFGDWEPERIEHLESAMRTLIVRTIEETHNYQFKDNGTIHPPNGYDLFIRVLIRWLRIDDPLRRSASILTFNYDIGIDYALEFHEIPIDYGFNDEEIDDGIPLLKLHGSLNWHRCSQCNEIKACKHKDMREYIGVERLRDSNKHNAGRLRMGSEGSYMLCCNNQAVPKGPIIVPPTWSKGEYHRSISKVWRRAAKELSEASTIFVAGFSLAESDVFFRHLFALGTVGNVPLRHFNVYDPDDSGSVKERYSNLLGPGAKQRFNYIATHFAEAINQMRKILARTAPS